MDNFWDLLFDLLNPFKDPFKEAFTMSDSDYHDGSSASSVDPDEENAPSSFRIDDLNQMETQVIDLEAGQEGTPYTETSPTLPTPDPGEYIVSVRKRFATCQTVLTEWERQVCTNLESCQIDLASINDLNRRLGQLTATLLDDSKYLYFTQKKGRVAKRQRTVVDLTQ